MSLACSLLCRIRFDYEGEGLLCDREDVEMLITSLCVKLSIDMNLEDLPAVMPTADQIPGQLPSLWLSQLTSLWLSPLPSLCCPLSSSLSFHVLDALPCWMFGHLMLDSLCTT